LFAVSTRAASLMISKQQIEQIGASLSRLGKRRLVLLAVSGLAIMATVVLAASFLARPALQPIYTGLTSQDVTRIAEALGDAGLQFDVNEQRNAVLVPFGQTARARTLLAQKGLPTSSRAGYELFDQMGSMGLTSFMQEVTRVRALEGEIARTIQALDGVAAARVHLVLPDPGSFRRDRREPSASVLLRLDSRWQTQAGQAVRHLVAAAVPGMKTEQVSIASTDGRLIATGGDEKTLSSMKLAEMERSMATELEQRASRTLASALGAGNYQISVTVRLDVDRQQTSETTFDPKSRIERSVRTVKQSGSTEDGGGKAAVSVEANVPREESAQVDGDKRRQREDRREELVNYELSSKTVQTVREGYRVQRIAIAAVVSRTQIAAQLGSGADAAAVDARLAELKRLVAAATGASPDRNDSIEIAARQRSCDPRSRHSARSVRSAAVDRCAWPGRGCGARRGPAAAACPAAGDGYR
jgi:flagellar M-ring protein FliF